MDLSEHHSDATPVTPDVETVAEMIDGATDDLLHEDAAASDGLRDRVARVVIERPALTLGLAAGIGFLAARVLRR